MPWAINFSAVGAPDHFHTTAEFCYERLVLWSRRRGRHLPVRRFPSSERLGFSLGEMGRRFAGFLRLGRLSSSLLLRLALTAIFVPMRILDRYVIRNFLEPFFLCFFGFLAIWLVFDLY